MSAPIRSALLPATSDGWNCQEIGGEDAHPICRDLFDWYNAHRVHGVVPKSAVQADAFPPPLLPHLAMLEVMEDGQFRYRLFGTARRDAYGVDLTGHLLAEAVTGESNDFTHDLLRAIIQEGRPLLTRTRYRASMNIAYDRAVIPLVDGTGAVRWLLTAVQKVEGPKDRTVLEITAGDELPSGG